VKDQRRQQGVPDEQQCGDAGLPAEDDGDRAGRFGRDDDGKQGAWHADRRHVRRGRFISPNLAKAGQQEQQGEQAASGELGNALDRYQR
jgi:hypothetical protein